MRKLLLGVATAGVVGTSMIALPSALASSHSDATAKPAASSNSAQKASEQEDKDKKDKDTKHRDKKHKGNHGHHCHYPTNDPHLSLSASSNESKVRLTGTLKKNKCDLDDEDVEVFEVESGKLVGTANTNANGSYSISLRVSGTSTYVAKFAGDNSFSPATSNTVKVKADR
jgi:hypothetical protein